MLPTCTMLNAVVPAVLAGSSQIVKQADQKALGFASFMTNQRQRARIEISMAMSCMAEIFV